MTDVLDRYHNSKDTFGTLHGTLVTQTYQGEFTEEVWYREPSTWRQEISGTLNDLGPLVPGHTRVNQGLKHFLLRVPRREYCQPTEVEVEASGLTGRIDDQLVGIPAALDLTTAEVVEEDTIAGRPALKLLIDADLPNRFVWIDAVYGVRLAYDYDAETATISHSEFTEIEFNEHIEDRVFDAGVSGFTQKPCDEVVNY